MKTYRISNIPYELDKKDIQENFSDDVVIDLLAPAANSTDSYTKKVALVTAATKIKASSIQVKREVLERKGLTDRRYFSLVIDTSFLGLTPLNSIPARDDIKMDVIAVTGLGGHAFGSWKAKNEDYMWLCDSLPHDIGGLRILTYGYQSKLTGSNSYAHIRDYAKELLGALMGARDDAEARRRPLVLLAHSLGGLVVKQALVEAATSGDSSALDLVKSTIGLLFFGVPNRGLSIETLMPMVEGRPNETFIKSLEPDSAFLEVLHQSFATSFKFKDSEIVSFYETCKSPTAQKLPDGAWEMTGPLDTLVSKASATGSRPFEPLFNDFPINSSHSEMVKFKDESDGGYIFVRDKIRKFREHGNATIKKHFDSQNDEGKVSRAKNGWTPLHLASDQGNTEKVILLLDQGLDIEARSNNEDTPLHRAAAGGHDTTIQILLERGANIEARNCAGSTPLYQACDSGTHIAVKCLLDRGANFETQTTSGWTPLHRASNLGKEEIVKFLVENGADIKNRGKLSCEPIHTAAKAGRPAIIRYLVSKGAQLEAEANGMSTPLHFACYERQFKAVEELLNLGANINAKENTSYSYTPLCYAAERADTNIVNLLLVRGADLCLKKAGASPLHVAALQGHVSVVKLFLKHDPLLIESISNDGSEYTPLLAATQNGREDLVRFLLDHQPAADIEARAKDTSSALHIASCNGRLQVAKLLIERGANIESRSSELSTPLFAAVIARKVDLTTLLLDHGANINAKTFLGHTTLFAAMMYGTEQIVELLLDRGAEIEAKFPITIYQKAPGYFGQNTQVHSYLHNFTPLLFAAYKPDGSNMLKLLLKKGANLHATEGMLSALHYTCASRNLSTMNILIDSGSDVNGKHTWSGIKPLHIAVEHGWEAGVKLLLKRNADVNGKLFSLWTPLHFAAASGQDISMAKILLDHGADPTTKDRLWRTPLYLAKSNKNYNLAGFLKTHISTVEKSETKRQNTISWRYSLILFLLFVVAITIGISEFSVFTSANSKYIDLAIKCARESWFAEQIRAMNEFREWRKAQMASSKTEL